MHLRPHSSLRPKIERDAAVRTVFVEQADAALGVAEGDEVFAEQTDANRRAIGLGDLARQQRRHPIAAHRIAHRGARSNPGDQLVFFARQHRRNLLAGSF
jgi:hypothetical protein